MKIYIMNKKGTSIAIVLLVLMALTLSLLALYSFNKKTGNFSVVVKDARFLDEVYARENEVNFYVNNIIEKAVMGIDKNNFDKTRFIENFKKELLKYKRKQGWAVFELSQVESQINENAVEIIQNGENKTVSVTFSIKIEKNFDDKFLSSYLYEKKFERKIM